ncbi:MAG: ribbon-helix-helix domain-containing protein [Microcoleus sp.]
MIGTTLIERSAPMPTKLKRISVALDDEAYAKLEDLARGSKRSIANMAAVLIEGSLFPGGRIATPRVERRGGKRSGAGRKRLIVETPIDNPENSDS